jgi:hypothetical protein
MTRIVEQHIFLSDVPSVCDAARRELFLTHSAIRYARSAPLAAASEAS